MLTQLRELGVRLPLDEFGTGCAEDRQAVRRRDADGRDDRVDHRSEFAELLANRRQPVAVSGTKLVR
jgi:hypothetical protein